ncbi:putative cAMP-dependent protein kinase type 1 [Blattamonas nauphoetae]|uniref:non-specific serine/threonine protein kinase n=1 Tax=Blattamonas nauphoetae TaxID=2049346 RepID=A0ABQ9XVN0_9EUKA|nr:putative cAMP-dependent protein kinase type 1 [Blattamonas nauphoetae]
MSRFSRKRNQAQYSDNIPTRSLHDDEDTFKELDELEKNLGVQTTTDRLREETDDAEIEEAIDYLEEFMGTGQLPTEMTDEDLSIVLTALKELEDNAETSVKAIMESLNCLRAEYEMTPPDERNPIDLKLIQEEEDATEKGLKKSLESVRPTRIALEKWLSGTSRDPDELNRVLQEYIVVRKAGNMTAKVIDNSSVDLAEYYSASMIKACNIINPFIIEVDSCMRTVDGNRHVLFLEYADQGNLSAIIKANENRGIPEHLAKHILYMLLSGLTDLHQNGFIHRDIKPSNLLFAYDPLRQTVRLVISDFSFLKRIGEPAPFSSTNHTICGTPLFMPPEAVKKDPYDHKLDIWAAGCVFYEMLTGEHPFKTESMSELDSKILSGPNFNHPILAPLILSCPPLDDLLHKMFAQNPADRIDTLGSQLLNHPYFTTTFPPIDPNGVQFQWPAFVGLQTGNYNPQHHSPVPTNHPRTIPLPSAPTAIQVIEETCVGGHQSNGVPVSVPPTQPEVAPRNRFAKRQQERDKTGTDENGEDFSRQMLEDERGRMDRFQNPANTQDIAQPTRFSPEPVSDPTPLQPQPAQNRFRRTTAKAEEKVTVACEYCGVAVEIGQMEQHVQKMHSGDVEAGKRAMEAQKQMEEERRRKREENERREQEEKERREQEETERRDREQVELQKPQRGEERNERDEKERIERERLRKERETEEKKKAEKDKREQEENQRRERQKEEERRKAEKERIRQAEKQRKERQKESDRQYAEAERRKRKERERREREEKEARDRNERAEKAQREREEKERRERQKEDERRKAEKDRRDRDERERREREEKERRERQREEENEKRRNEENGREKKRTRREGTKRTAERRREREEKERRERQREEENEKRRNEENGREKKRTRREGTKRTAERRREREEKERRERQREEENEKRRNEENGREKKRTRREGTKRTAERRREREEKERRERQREEENEKRRNEENGREKKRTRREGTKRTAERRREREEKERRERQREEENEKRRNEENGREKKRTRREGTKRTAERRREREEKERRERQREEENEKRRNEENGREKKRTRREGTKRTAERRREREEKERRERQREEENEKRRNEENGREKKRTRREGTKRTAERRREREEKERRERQREEENEKRRNEENGREKKRTRREGTKRTAERRREREEKERRERQREEENEKRRNEENGREKKRRDGHKRMSVNPHFSTDEFLPNHSSQLWSCGSSS